MCIRDRYMGIFEQSYREMYAKPVHRETNSRPIIISDTKYMDPDNTKGVIRRKNVERVDQLEEQEIERQRNFQNDQELSKKELYEKDLQENLMPKPKGREKILAKAHELHSQHHEKDFANMTQE
eukprot:TRINITY_DN2135_c0_g1_i3.p1 TRINITY_DN2135_c0_g1~~TRINITY_DN2135_c0_g1_i3.p1  ORF type:complete len:124 (-),score=35.69 TRINITY_DN2135_c0_g1_i3:163-534(-)